LRIPSELAQLPLKVLNVYDNKLSGTVPKEIIDPNSPIFVPLNDLLVGENNISGIVYTEYGSLAQLAKLDLDFNNLQGSIPTQLGQLVNLVYLNLYRNSLTGTIPTQLGNLVKLTGLELHVNQIEGTIPSQLGRLTRLTTLMLSDTNLCTDCFPASWSKLSFAEGKCDLSGIYAYCSDMGCTAPTSDCLQEDCDDTSACPGNTVGIPSDSPSDSPSGSPSGSPTHSPTGSPTGSPHSPTSSSAKPSGSPTGSPHSPTGSSSKSPTSTPHTSSPTQSENPSGIVTIVKEDSGALTAGAVAGIVVGVIIAVLLVLLLIILVCFKDTLCGGGKNEVTTTQIPSQVAVQSDAPYQSVQDS